MEREARPSGEHQVAELAFGMGQLAALRPMAYDVLNHAMKTIDDTNPHRKEFIKCCFMEGHYRECTAAAYNEEPAEICSHELVLEGRGEMLIADAAHWRLEVASQQIAELLPAMQPTNARSRLLGVGVGVLTKRFGEELEKYDQYVQEQGDIDGWEDLQNDFVIDNSTKMIDAWEKGTEWKISYLAPGIQMRRIIQHRQAPYAITSNKAARFEHMQTVDLREMAARKTLLRMIGDKAYSAFLRKGCLTIKGSSGKHYRIYTGHQVTEVYDKNIHLENLCVVLDGKFCATDSLIMRMILIMNDESAFRQTANVTKPYSRRRPVEATVRPQKSLVEIYRKIKREAA